MQIRNSFKIYLGTILFAAIVLINLYVAANYYFLNRTTLTQFFIWQTNIEKPADEANR